MCTRGCLFGWPLAESSAPGKAGVVGLVGGLDGSKMLSSVGRVFIPDFILQRPSSFIPVTSLKPAVQRCFKNVKGFHVLQVVVRATAFYEFARGPNSEQPNDLSPGVLNQASTALRTLVTPTVVPVALLNIWRGV